MKTVKIFVASSEELGSEREMMASLANSLNTVLESQGVQVIVVQWENLDSSIGKLHKQEEYNEKLCECEICIVLYWKKFGMYTKMEFDAAYERLIAGNNPKKLYVYFKRASDPAGEINSFKDSFPTKYGHFYTNFENIDTLKAHFLLQFMEYQNQILKNANVVEIKDGKVIVGGKEYVTLNNVPFAGNNEEYNLLQKNIKKTRKLLAITDPNDIEYVEYAEELMQMQDKLSKMEANLWDTALLITRLSTTKCSERLSRAMDMFSKGDNKGAQAILDEEEIEKDVEHNINLIKLGEEGKKGLKANIDEYCLKCKILGAEMPDGWIESQCKLMERVVELSSCLYGCDSLETAQAMMDAVQVFDLYEDFNKVYEFSKKALDIRLAVLGENHLDIAQCYNDIGVASGTLGRFKEAFEYCSKGLDIRHALNAEPAILAESYNTVATAYFFRHGDNEKSLEYSFKALELRKSVFGEMSLETANSYSQVAGFYFNLDDYEKSLEYALRSLEIIENIVGPRHPDNALSHNNVAASYILLGDYTKAIEHLQKALEISISTIGKIKHTNIAIYENLGVAYEGGQEFMRGDKHNAINNYKTALEITEQIYGKEHPQMFGQLRRCGMALCDSEKEQEALVYLYRAYDLYHKIAEEENLPNAQELSLDYCDICTYIGICHYFNDELAASRQMLNEAKDVILSLDDGYPMMMDRVMTYLEYIEEDIERMNLPL